MDQEALIKFKAERFRERLESLVKKYPPAQYAEMVSMKIHEAFHNHRLLGQYPIHFLLHSIQANCAFYNTNRTEVLTEIKLQQILNHYRQYYDPVAIYFSEKEDGIEPLFINLLRQQFFTQQGYGTNAIGRSSLLFTGHRYPKSEKYMMDTYGISFTEWFYIGFALSTIIMKQSIKMVSEPHFINRYRFLASEGAIISFFRQNSISVSEVKTYNQQLDEKIGIASSRFNDTYLQGVFVEKPMLQLNETDYLIVHAEVFLKKVIEGIFDLCKKDIPSDFGMEFGHHFEKYIIKLLQEFIPAEHIFTERQLRQLTDKKICDVMLVFDDYIFLLECKAVEYSSYIATENSMKGDNSSRKIATGFDQLCSTVELIRSGVLNSLIGESHNKKVIASVITYKQLYLSNSKWYYENNILPHIKSEKETVEQLFAHRPQVMSVEELEMLLTTSKNNSKRYYDMFHERLAHGDYFLQVDWNGVLDQKHRTIPLLKENFSRLTGAFIQKLKDEKK